jgi:DNA repair protein RadC
MIKDIPNSEKPREWMIKYGVENISNEDLLAIAIKSGAKFFSSRHIANLQFPIIYRLLISEVV